MMILGIAESYEKLARRAEGRSEDKKSEPT
jgi:hypothetical protein